jgi:hypothetical protein
MLSEERKLSIPLSFRMSLLYESNGSPIVFEWDSQNSIGDPFDSYSNDILNDKGIDNFLSSDSITSFNQI